MNDLGNSMVVSGVCIGKVPSPIADDNIASTREGQQGISRDAHLPA